MALFLWEIRAIKGHHWLQAVKISGLLTFLFHVVPHTEHPSSPNPKSKILWAFQGWDFLIRDIWLMKRCKHTDFEILKKIWNHKHVTSQTLPKMDTQLELTISSSLCFFCFWHPWQYTLLIFHPPLSIISHVLPPSMGGLLFSTFIEEGHVSHGWTSRKDVQPGPQVQSPFLTRVP